MNLKKRALNCPQNGTISKKFGPGQDKKFDTD